MFLIGNGKNWFLNNKFVYLDPDSADLEGKKSSNFLVKFWKCPTIMNCLLLFLLYGFLACHAGTARVAHFRFLFQK